MDPFKRLAVPDLLQHELFDPSFKDEFEKEFGVLPGAKSKKIKSKIMLIQGHTPEPNTYMSIYKRKKSPKFVLPSKNSEESIRIKKYSPSNYKTNEKSYFLPDIIKREDNISRKKSNQLINKILEIRTEPKSTIKSSEATNNFQNSRNMSIIRDNSTENFVNHTFAHQLITKRGPGQLAKDINLLSPDGFSGISLIPHKYKFKKHKEIQSIFARGIDPNFIDFSPVHKHKKL